MKNQHFLLLSLVLLTCPPLCLAGKKKGVNAYRNNQTYEDLTYTNNQTAEATSSFEQVTKNDGTPSIVIEAPKKESQFAPGTFYKEINKWFFTDARGLAKQVMAPFKTDQGCKLAIGTGDAEENSALFSRVLRSHVKYSQYDDAREVFDFTDTHKIAIAQDAREGFQKLLENRVQQLAAHHEELAPIVSKDKNVQKQQATIIAALERLKTTNPEIKK